jgi:hypothetical protein
MKKKIVAFLLLIIITNCKTNDCEDYACFTPPPMYAFELVDNTTGENIFLNKILNSNEIRLTNEENKPITFQFISENNLNIITTEIGWEIGLHSYKLSVGANLEIDILLNIKEVHENCCTFFKVIEFQILNYEFEQLNNSEIIKIKID